MLRVNLSPFPHCLSISSFSLLLLFIFSFSLNSSFSFHFLILSPFTLHFLILSPFSHSQAGRLAQLVQPCLSPKQFAFTNRLPPKFMTSRLWFSCIGSIISPYSTWFWGHSFVKWTIFSVPMSQFSYQFASPNSICELVFEGLPLSNSYKFDRFQNQKIRFTAQIVQGRHWKDASRGW